MTGYLHIALSHRQAPGWRAPRNGAWGWVGGSLWTKGSLFWRNSALPHHSLPMVRGRGQRGFQYLWPEEDTHGMLQTIQCISEDWILWLEFFFPGLYFFLYVFLNQHRNAGKIIITLWLLVTFLVLENTPPQLKYKTNVSECSSMSMQHNAGLRDRTTFNGSDGDN